MSERGGRVEGGKAVVFRLAAEHFALPVTVVREILDYRAACAIPGAPDWLLGLIDVRGASVLMVDLRRKLGLTAAEPSLTTRILVTDIEDAGGASRMLGLVVDRVLDVRDVATEAREDLPPIAGNWDRRAIAGIMRGEDGFVILLDAPAIFSSAILCEPSLPENLPENLNAAA